jgi:DNA replication and repair protein RecF
LLLDEVAAHLDEDRRMALYNILSELKMQVWMTGTERSLFSEIEKKSIIFNICDYQAKRIDYSNSST